MKIGRNTERREQAETMSAEEIVEETQRALEDLIVFMKQGGAQLSPNLIIQGPVHDHEKKEEIEWSSNFGNKIKLKIERFGEKQNETSYAQIGLYPIDRKQTNLVEGNEEELVDEFVTMGKIKPNQAYKTLKKLKNINESGTNLIQFNFTFINNKHIPGEAIPIGFELMLKTGSNNTISINLIGENGEIPEDLGEYSRLVLTNALTKFKSILEMEKMIATGRALSMALGNECQIESLMLEIKSVLQKI